jgi:hypothetical protein
MPITITLSDELAKRLEAMAAEARRPVNEVVEILLAEVMEDVEFDRELPVVRLPPDSPPLTEEQVNRLRERSDT